MRPLPAGLTLFLLQILCVGAAALAARWLRRPIPRRWLLLLVLPPVLFLWQGFLQGKTPLTPDHAYLTAPHPAAAATSVWSDDVARQFAPWARAVRASWESGEMPHRNRWNGSGMVLDANGSSSAYFPLTLLGMLLPLPAAFTFWGAARLFLCLAGTWLWLSELRVSPRASFFGAVAFSFSLSLTAWLQFPQAAVLSLWPWILWTIERLRERAVRRRAFALLALLFVLLPLAGHVETVASMSAFTGLWLAVRWISGDREGAAGVLACIAGAALLALGLTAFSLLPQALAIRDSNRLALVERPFWTPILSLRPHAPAWASGLLALLLPRLFGDLVTAPEISGAPGVFPEVALGYFGTVAAGLAALVARPGSRRPVAERALLVPLGLALGVAIGCWPFAETAALLPGLGRMFPLRYLTWAALAGSAIAAFELDRLARDLPRHGARLWAIAAMAACLLAIALAYARLRPLYAAAGALPAQRRAYLLGAAALVAAIGVLIASSGRANRFAALGIPLLTLLEGAELYRQGVRLNRMSDPELLYPATPLVTFLATQRGSFRIVGEGASLFPNVGVFAGLEDVRTHDPVERRDYVEFLGATCAYDLRAYFKQVADVNAPALDFLNVRYLVSHAGRTAPSEKWRPVYSGPDGTVFENRSVLPRAFAPERIRIRRHPVSGRLMESASSAYGMGYRELFRDLDWSREAVALEDGGGRFSPSAGKALVTEYAETSNHASFRTRTDPAGRGALLVTSLVQDGGWRAYDETGASLPTGRANGPFLAVSAPPGDHRIRLDYATPGFRLGARISLGSLALAAGAALAFFRKRRRSPSAATPAEGSVAS